MKGLIAGAALSVALTGCAGMQQRQAENMAEFNRTVPVCVGEEQCKIAWAHARNWVIQHCGMKIQNITDTYIETYGSSDTSLACRVIGEPRGVDSWAMVIKTGCGNIFGCVPDAWGAALQFNRTMAAAIGTTQYSKEAIEAASATSVDIPGQ